MRKLASNSVTQLEYHLVWNTMYRNQALSKEIRQAMTEKITTIVQDNNCDVIAIIVMPNYVHLEVVMPPNLSVTELMKKLKGITARWAFDTYPELRNSFAHHHLWSKSYFAKTTGICSDETIKNYIETQWKNENK